MGSLFYICKKRSRSKVLSCFFNKQAFSIKRYVMGTLHLIFQKTFSIKSNVIGTL